MLLLPVPALLSVPALLPVVLLLLPGAPSGLLLLLLLLRVHPLPPVPILLEGRRL